MTTQKIGMEVLKIAEQVLGYSRKDVNAVITLKDGSRMTSMLHIFTTPEGQVIVNPNAKISYIFDDEQEFLSSDKFEMFESEKEMYKTFTGMTDEDWEAWNED